MKFLGNIDELKDIVVKRYVDQMAGKQLMYPIYLPADSNSSITNDQKAINKEAFDAYAEYIARDYAEPGICIYMADMPKNILVLPFESLDGNGKLESLDVFANTSIFGGYSGYESVYNLFFGGTIMPDGSVANVDESNLMFELPTVNSFKTINNQSLIGTGNIAIPSGIQTEEDPVFKASPAAKITDSNITNWNKAEANVQSDWNATSGDAYIKNKPTIPAAVTEATVSGWGFTKNTGTYSKPSTGIPKTDLASSVQASLDKADTALQSEQYKGTVTGIKMNGTTKSPSSGIVDLGTVPTTIDSVLSSSSTNPVQNKAITNAVNALDSRVNAIEEFFEQGAKLTLAIKSNQGVDSIIAAVKATVQYGDTSIQAGSGVIGLPSFSAVKIVFPHVDGYKTPEPIEFETTGLPISFSATYETELVKVNLSAWDGSSVVGQVVTIDGTPYTWNGITIEHKIAIGSSYSITTNGKEGYLNPKENFIASQVTRDITLVYGELLGSWIKIDQTITDPATMITGDINGEHIRLIRSNSHRYLGKYTAEGVMTISQLDDGNSNYYKDGSAAILTGAEGDVFMRLPKFYYYAYLVREDVWNIGFYYGNSAPSSDWKVWDGNDLIGVYKTQRASSMLYSISGTNYNGSVSITDYKTNARNRGQGYTLVKWKHHNIMAFLFYAMYGNMNCQAIIGAGATDSHTTGQTDALGMEDTLNDGGNSPINFWGLEDWWGYKSEYIDNVVFNPVTGNGVWKITEDDGEERDVQGVKVDGYMSKAIIGENLDLIPSSTAVASETTGYCDKVMTNNGGVNRYVRRSNITNALAGVAYFTVFDVTSRGSSFVSRLCFRGTIIINNDSTAFKALTAIN